MLNNEDTRASLDRSQRRTFAHESHRAAPLTAKAAEWDRRWLEGSSGLQVPKGMQHPTPFETMADQLAGRRSVSPSLTPFQYARESLSPVRSWTDGARHAAVSGHSTQGQLAHTAYLFGEPDNVSAVQPGRLSLTLTGVNGDLGLPVVTPSVGKLRSGAVGGAVGQEMLNRSATSMTRPSPAVALINKAELTHSTHGHLSFERKGGPGGLEERRQHTVTWTRKDHPFEPNSNKVWGGKETSHQAPAWPYNDRVRGGQSPEPMPMGLMKDVTPAESSTVKPASTSNQLYGAHVAQSPHDARRGRPITPHNIAQHSTAFFGPVNWRSQKAQNWEKRLTLSPVRQRPARASGDRLDMGQAAGGLGYGRFSASSPDIRR
jgi:hypothetical protein